MTTKRNKTKRYRYILPINLSFFEAGEKSEQPTSKKKDKARSEGQVARSKEIGTAVLFIFGFLSLKMFGGYMYRKLMTFFYQTLLLIGDINVIYNPDYFVVLVKNVMIVLVLILAPIFCTIMVVSVIANLIQVGWKPTTKPLKLKFNFINVVQGLKKIFNKKNLAELFKSFLKMILIGSVIYSMIQKEIVNIQMLINMDISLSLLHVCNLAIDMGIRVGIYFILIAVLDYVFVRRSHTKQLKMSKQEVKDEYKMSEGDPHIKGQIKAKMREISMRRMMQNISTADVVITNPTHYAVAVKYDKEKSLAPIVIAKGVDHLAKRIKERAAENHIEIVENVQLARTLYATVDVGREIPPELYQAVAEILAFVYKLRNVM